MQMCYFNASNDIQPLLNAFFAYDGLTGPKTYLILNPDKSRCSIIIYCSTMKSSIGPFLTITNGKPTRSPTNKFIGGDKIPNFQLIATYSSLRIKVCLNSFNFGRSMSSPSQLTRLALWNCTIRCGGKLALIIGGWHCGLPSGSSKVQFLIMAWIHCIPILNFQFQRIYSLWANDKFSFPRLPTHGKLEKRPCCLDEVDKLLNNQDNILAKWSSAA